MTAQDLILEQTGRLIDAIGKPDFPTALRQSIDALAPIDSFIVLAYLPHRTPVVLHNGLRPEEHPVFFENYLNGAYLLSPLAPIVMAFIMTRSTLKALKSGQVEWRGTRYDLDTLKASQRVVI